MQDTIINILNNFGYLGVFSLIMIENLFPPIPSELILLFGGFMTTYTKLTIFGMIIFSTLASLFGTVILYYIGKIFNKERLKKIISGKVGKILRLKESDIDSSNKWFDTKGQKTVFFCRFIPLIRSLISIPAGMNEMPMIKFISYTLLGSLIWNSVLIIIGSIVGENWINILNVLDIYSKYIVILLGIALIIIVIMFYRRKYSNEKSIQYNK